MQITYDSSSAADQFRCNLYCMTAKPARVLFCSFPGFIMGGGLSSILRDGKNWIYYAILGAVIFWGWFVFVVFMAAARRAACGPRICTTTLTPQGVVDLVPERTIFLPWGDMTGIRCHRGDVYFLMKSTGGSFIPHTAFPNEAAARGYCDAARAAQKGDYRGLGGPPMLAPGLQDRVSAGATVWPPAPSSPYGPGGPYPPSPSGYPGQQFGAQSPFPPPNYPGAPGPYGPYPGQQPNGAPPPQGNLAWPVQQSDEPDPYRSPGPPNG
ncbi:MAG: hypothetical protein ACLQVD_00530 [Capsulimonadaceae bacterium]